MKKYLQHILVMGFIAPWTGACCFFLFANLGVAEGLQDLLGGLLGAIMCAYVGLLYFSPFILVMVLLTGAIYALLLHIFGRIHRGSSELICTLTGVMYLILIKPITDVTSINIPAFYLSVLLLGMIHGQSLRRVWEEAGSKAERVFRKALRNSMNQER